MFEIYRITNIANSKAYVGLTSLTTDRRWQRHIGDAVRHGNNMLLGKAIRKYGVGSFVVDVIAFAFTAEEGRATERHFIREFGTFKPAGYNLTLGGEGVFGYKFTKEQRAKMSRALLGRKGAPWSEEKRAYFSALYKGRPNLHALGKPTSPETRAKLSAALKGKPCSENARLAVIESNKRRRGTKHRKYSAEGRANCSRAQRGRKVSPEVVAKIAAANRGKKRSKEFCEQAKYKALRRWRRFRKRRAKALVRNPARALGLGQKASR